MLKRRRSDQDNNPLEPNSFASPPAPSPEAIQRRQRRRGSFLRQLGALAGVLAVLYLGPLILLRSGKIAPIVEQTLSQQLGRPVHIGSLHCSPLFGSIVVEDLSIADDPLFSPAPFLHARRVKLSVERFPLLFGRSVEITGISLEEPTIILAQNLGQWNYYAILANSSSPDETAGPSIRIDRGILVVGSGDEDEPFVLRDVSFHAAHFSLTQDNPFTMTAGVVGGGSLKVNGRMGPVRWSGGTPLLPVNALVSATKVALAESHLMRSVAPGMGGQFSFSGSVESDDARVGVSGNAEFSKLKLSSKGDAVTDPLKFVFAADYDRASGAGTLSRCDAIVSKGTAGIAGTYAVGSGDVRVNLHATAQGVFVTAFSGLVTAAGLPLPPGTSFQGGLAFVDLKIEGPLKGLRTKGTVSAKNTKMMAFGLDERLSGVTGLDALQLSRDLPLDSLRVNVEMTPERIVFTNMEIELPEVGVMTGGGVIDADRMLDLQMSALRTGVTEKRPIPFLVRGACVSPVFRQAGKT